EHAVLLDFASLRVPAILDARDRHDAPGLFDVADLRVAEPYVSDLSLFAQTRECADAFGEGHPRIRRVQRQQVDGVDTQRLQAAVGGFGQVLGPRVDGPSTTGAAAPDLRHDGDLF